MEDLFAMEGDLRCAEDMDPPEVLRSAVDPVLKDSRVLKNILDRQDFLCSKEDYFKTVQQEIKPHMRKIVSDWMLEVCMEQECQSEVFHLAMNYIDRFLSRVSIRKSQFQLLACVCLFLASKFKETRPLPAENLVIYTENSVTIREITSWELVVLNVLQWDLSAVTGYSILDQLLQSLELQDDLKMEMVRQHAETLVALATTEHIFIQKSPGLVAVASLAAALRGLRFQYLDEMIQRLHLTTGVEKSFITECMQEIDHSINLSMNGTSYQPVQSQKMTVPPPNSTPKMKIPACGKEGSDMPASYTTPTDLMEVADNYVY